jgi:signal recognition particle receptor subunit beta
MYRKSAKEKALSVGEVLLIGCEGAGKTLLCNHLEKITKGKADALLQSETQASIGVELIEVPHRSRLIAIREIGGTMQPMWNRYFDVCASIIVVADSSTPHAAVSAAVELAEVLSTPTAMGKRVMLVLNKRDVVGAPPEASVRQLLRLPTLEAATNGRLTVLCASALTGDGLPQLLDWCYDSCIAAAAAAAIAAAAEKSAAKASSKATKHATKSRWSRSSKKAKGEDPHSADAIKAAEAAARGAAAAKERENKP